jgi:hypothetical protein
VRPHYTVADVAGWLGTSDEDVRALIDKHQLPAEFKAGRWQIPADDFERYCAEHGHRRVDKREVVFTRRGLGKRAVLWAMGFMFTTSVSTGVGLKAQQILDAKADDEAARELFQVLFGFREPGRFDYIYGRPTYWGSYHPYHRLAGDALAAPLGLRDSRDRPLQQPHGLPQQRKGDKVVFGGPNSTEETARAWGYAGRSHRELRRVKSSLPLRWYGISAESELGTEEGVVIVYGMGKDRVAETKNWPIVDVQRGTQLVSDRRPLTSDELSALPPLASPSDRARLPTTNYLVLTRLPNFLDSDFGTAGMEDFTLLVVSGVNGVGTRAAELLPTQTGLQALEDLSRQVGVGQAFQALFEAYDVKAAPGGTHRFRRIRYLCSHPLPSDPDSYEAAHRQAVHVGQPS